MAMLKKFGAKKIWLVLWGCHTQNEDACLKQSGIKKKLIDVISIRKDFDVITEIAIDIYMREILSFSEKVYLSNYTKGARRKKEFFGGSVPVFTHYQSDLYRELIKDSGLNSKKSEELRKKWIKQPEYIVVGHNPYLEIVKVFNFLVYESENGNEIIEWNRPLVDGRFKKEKYEFKN